MVVWMVALFLGFVAPSVQAQPSGSTGSSAATGLEDASLDGAFQDAEIVDAGLVEEVQPPPAEVCVREGEIRSVGDALCVFRERVGLDTGRTTSTVSPTSSREPPAKRTPKKHTIKRACGDDEHELNDERGRARSAGGPVVQGRLCAGDEDWFWVKLEPGESLELKSAELGATIQKLEVYVPRKKTPQVSITRGGARFKAEKGGRYRVRVVGQGQDGAYQLLLTVRDRGGRVKE